jgi:ribosomal protein S18 acetylase RimI-like enzyme
MNEIDFNIRSALSRDRSRLANLIHFGSHIHQHLDWKPPLDWIGSNPYLLLENNNELMAALACPPDLPGITWIRLFAASTMVNIDRAWRMLWDAVVQEFAKSGNINIAAISLQSWFNEILEASAFKYTDNVVVLMWERSVTLPNPLQIDTNIRPMMPEDLVEVMGIDHKAFSGVWKNSLESIELAYQQSTLASVAEIGEELVGYQYSTSSAMGGHLARLAVKPSAQGKGIGYLLIHQVLSHFQKQGIRHVTVNTQQNNHASLALYAKAGFNITGEAYRVYQQTVAS